MKISKLYNRFKGQNKEAYIIGTGPTADLFPSSMFRDKITIGLNEAFKLYSCSYSITIHPELIPDDYWKFRNVWITKRKGKFAKHQDKDDLNIYWFNNQSDVKDYSSIGAGGESLYVGRGIHTAACVLAAEMGLARVFLCGVDMSLAPQRNATGEVLRDSRSTTHRGDSYSSISHQTAFHGLNPVDVTREYYLNFVELRTILKQKFPDFSILNLSPCVPAYWKEDYQRITKDMPALPVPKDVSTYTREKLDFH